MGNKALKDLDLAGVQWELAETPLKNDIQKTPIQQKSLKKQKITCWVNLCI